MGLLGPVQKLVSGGCDNTEKVWKLYNGMGKIDCSSCRVQGKSSCMILSRMKNIGMLNDWSNVHNILGMKSIHGRFVAESLLSEGPSDKCCPSLSTGYSSNHSMNRELATSIINGDC